MTNQKQDAVYLKNLIDHITELSFTIEIKAIGNKKEERSI